MSGIRQVARQGWSTRPDGRCLRFQVEGPAEGPAILLLQGQANSHVWWRRLRGAFADSFQTITFDYRGTGKSDVGDDRGWSTASFADDAVSVLDALGCHSADVYGTSMGGRVAQEFAINHPARLRKLVLACTSPGGPHAEERDASVRRALANPEPLARRRALVDLFYTPAAVRGVGGYESVPDDLLGDTTITTAAARHHLRLSAQHDAYDRLPTVAAPTLVLHGVDDLMVPASNAEILRARLPEAEVALVEGGRHGFFDEFQSEVTQRIRGFLER